MTALFFYTTVPADFDVIEAAFNGGIWEFLAGWKWYRLIGICRTGGYWPSAGARHLACLPAIGSLAIEVHLQRQRYMPKCTRTRSSISVRASSSLAWAKRSKVLRAMVLKAAMTPGSKWLPVSLCRMAMAASKPMGSL